LKIFRKRHFSSLRRFVWRADSRDQSRQEVKKYEIEGRRGEAVLERSMSLFLFLSINCLDNVGPFQRLHVTIAGVIGIVCFNSKLASQIELLN
jgi:hypothetical protein